MTSQSGCVTYDVICSDVISTHVLYAIASRHRKRAELTRSGVTVRPNSDVTLRSDVINGLVIYDVTMGGYTRIT